MLRNQRKTVLQAGKAIGLLAQIGLLLLVNRLFTRPLHVLVTHALHLAVKLHLPGLQSLLPGFKVLLPLGQRTFNHWPENQQFATEHQPLLLLLLQLGQCRLQSDSGKILATLGVQIGKRLVPFRLEIDAGVG